MMKIKIDLNAILTPIPGEKKTGENLRYDNIYDELKEARREEDELNQGDWRHEIKKVDWNKVSELSIDALTHKTKDIQIAVWLTEALTKTDGFEGLALGFKILTGLLMNYWDSIYPEIEGEDLESRVNVLEVINANETEGKASMIKQIPITDSKVSPGYSWLKWKESRKVGYEKNTRNQYGDVDEKKKKDRDEMIADGKLTAEDFDAAVDISTGAYYFDLEEKIKQSREAFDAFEKIVDDKFGSHAPRLAEFRKALTDLEQFVSKDKVAELILKEKSRLAPPPEQNAETDPSLQSGKKDNEDTSSPLTRHGSDGLASANQSSDSESKEKSVWEDALKKLKNEGIRAALSQIYGVSCSMPSVREKNRYRLLMVKLCLKAQRPDLARPIMEELYVLINELHLERWESPMWIAEIHDALYQCLISGTPDEADKERAKELFKKICTTDITKAITY